ncbi:MAG: LVIVD repeat-containing protein, partial [Xanthobacteraceae bacterium]
LQIIDYSNPSAPKEVGTWHVPGQKKGEQYGPLNRNGPDGKPQIIQCHEIVYYNDRVYAAWRDAGMQIIDVTDRSKPKLLATYDYVPPFHGGNLGAAHTSAPVVVRRGEHPDLIVHTDEIFDCPPGFGRILDVSDLKNPEVVKGERPANVVLLSTFRFDYVSDNFDQQRKSFICDGDGPGGRSGTTTHLPWFDQRSPSLVYITWYDEGVRAMDISNPFAPVFVGHFLSPRTGAPAWPGTTARKDRHTREIFQDPDTGLLYLTDGNGAGLMVLRYTGPIPDKSPIPGGR